MLHFFFSNTKILGRHSKAQQRQLPPFPDTWYRSDYVWQCVQHANHVLYKKRKHSWSCLNIYKGLRISSCCSRWEFIAELFGKHDGSSESPNALLWSTEAHRFAHRHTLLHAICQPYSTLNLFAHNFCQNTISSLGHVNPSSGEKRAKEGAPLSGTQNKSIDPEERTYLAQSLKAGGV